MNQNEALRNPRVIIVQKLYSKEFNDRYFHNIDAWKIVKSKESPLEHDLEENSAPF